MSSTFGGLTRAQTSLTAQQRGLDVTGQNITNATTDGYSRQRVDMQSVGGPTVSAVYSTGPLIGQGVNSDSVTRIRDAFLETRGLTEAGNAAALTQASDALNQIESAFREPSDNGLQSQLSDVWNSWSSLSGRSQVPAARTGVLETSKTFIAGLQTTTASLSTQWSQTAQSLQSLATDVTSTAASIASLNASIIQLSSSGASTNELADHRDQLVQKLAASIGATSSTNADGSIDVRVGGNSLVSGPLALALKVAGPATQAGVTSADSPRLVMDPGGYAVAVGGKAGAMVASLGPAVSGGTSINSFQAQLDSVAATFAASVNAANQSGFDQAGSPGGAVFGASSGTTITAGNLTLLISDGAKLAAAASPPAVPAQVGPPAVAAQNPSTDGSNADTISQLRLQTGGSDQTYQAMIVRMGVQVSAAANSATVQDTILTTVNSARESVSGVSLDEEMTNMLSYQHAYAAAGRMITAIDEALDVLINKTGLVGR